MKKVMKSCALLGIMILLFSTCAYAGTSYTTYNTTVGRFNGSGFSDYQTKTTGGANGYLMSTQVGGSYVVDARMNSSKANAPWLRNVTDGTRASLPGHYKQVSGLSIRVEFSNDISTPVNVQVSGTWRSN